MSRYGPRYRELAQKILAEIPGAQVEGSVGRRSSFEVVINNIEVHSKLKTMAFPDFDEVVRIAQEVSKGSEPQQVAKMQSSSCTVM
eukprot:TCALIF_12215-PA protein Name:"Protein of unknown function" AED:0.07 eAED:0.07 QI:0/0/0/0.5/1/1/2/0/85